MKSWWFISDFLTIPLRRLSWRRLRYRQHQKGFGVRLLSWSLGAELCEHEGRRNTRFHFFLCWWNSLFGGSEPGVHFVLFGRAAGPSLGPEWWPAHFPHDKVPGATVPFMSQPAALPLPQRGINARGRVKFWKSYTHCDHLWCCPDQSKQIHKCNRPVQPGPPAWEEGTELGAAMLYSLCFNVVMTSVAGGIARHLGGMISVTCDSGGGLPWGLWGTHCKTQIEPFPATSFLMVGLLQWFPLERGGFRPWLHT